MQVEFVDSLLSLLGKSITILVFIFSALWGAHKFWLSNVFLTKKEFRASQLEFENRVEDKIGKIFSIVNDQKDQSKSLEREFAVFKASYKGDMDLLKEQMGHANEINKQILHRVNNMAAIDIKNIMSSVIDEKLKGK